MIPAHNPDKSFGGGLKYHQLMGKSFEEVIEAFHGRHKAWYIEPIKKLGDSGFVMTMTSCVLIDILSQYYFGIDKHQEDKYVEYVRELDPLFKETIDPAIISKRFKGRNKGDTEPIDNLAYAFFHGFRCGIVHGGRILEYGRISGPEVAPKIIQIRKWGTKDENQEVAINSRLLFECVEKNFADYVKRLQNKDESELRENFIKKFELDFGIKPTI